MARRLAAADRLIAGVLVLFAWPACVAGLAPAPMAVDLGIMQGRPVPSDKRVTLANWMSPPFNRWSLQHLPQVLPTAVVSRGEGPVAALPLRKRSLRDLRIETAPGETVSLSEWLAASYTDGFIVLKNGRIAFEAYLNGMTPQTRHLSYSLSKSVIGVLAGVLVDEGSLDLSRKVEAYLPELQASGFAGYPVRAVLDMLPAIDWREDYSDPRGPWWRWKEAIGWVAAIGDGAHAPRGNYEFLPGLRADSEWRGGFRYASPTAEVAGWVLERTGGMPLAELLSERLWIPLGAQHDAYITTDSSFAPSAAGGFGATLRDLARFGQMVLNQGSFNGRRIVSPAWIDDIRHKGSNADWRRGQYRGRWNPEGAYRSFWYVTGDADGSFEAIGIHGQRLHINPERGLVFVRLSSHPDAASREDYELCSKVIAAVRSAL